MNPQEAQQAQTIAEMKRRHKYQDSVLETKLSYESGIFRDCHSDREMLLEIVDSQTQRIAELMADLIGLESRLYDAQARIEKLEYSYSHIVQTNRQRGKS